MQSKLSDFIDNLSEINKKDCKACMEGKKIKSECDFIGVKNNRLNYKYKESGKKCSKLMNETFRTFSNVNQFCNDDINKFALLLRKGVYAYECMDSWERYNEKSLPDKEPFYSELNKEGITDNHYLIKNLSTAN